MPGFIHLRMMHVCTVTRLLVSMFLLAGLGRLCHRQVDASFCIDTVPSLSDRGIGKDYSGLQADTRRGFVAIMSNYTFGCDGIVTQWMVRWTFTHYQKCEIIVDFYILRPTSVDGYCYLRFVGKNRLIVQADERYIPEEEMIVFNVSESDGVEVVSGDIVGLSVFFNKSPQCRYRSRVNIMESVDTNDHSLIYYRRAWDEHTLDLVDIKGFSGCGGDYERSKTQDEFTTRDRSHTRTSTRDRSRTSESYRSRTSESWTSHTSETSTFESPRRHWRTKRDDITDFQLYIGAPLIDAIVDSNQASGSTVAPNGEEKQQETGDSPTERSRRLLVPLVSVVVSLLLLTAGVTVAVCACYIVRQRQKREEDCPMSDNMAYSKSLPEDGKSATSQVEHISSPPAQRGSSVPVHWTKPALSPSKTTPSTAHTSTEDTHSKPVVVKKKPPKPPRCIMKHNIAYGTHSPTQTAALSSDMTAARSTVSGTCSTTSGTHSTTSAAHSTVSGTCSTTSGAHSTTSAAHSTVSGTCSTTSGAHSTTSVARSTLAETNTNDARYLRPCAVMVDYHYIVDGTIYEVPSTV